MFEIRLILKVTLEGSGDWSSTVKCRWAWHHNASVGTTSKMTRVVLESFSVRKQWTRIILQGTSYGVKFVSPLPGKLAYPEIIPNLMRFFLPRFQILQQINWIVSHKIYIFIVVLISVILSFFCWLLCCLIYRLPIWYLKILVLYWSFTVPLESSFDWHTWKTCCVCLHKTSRFYEIDIVVNAINVVLKFLDENTIFYLIRTKQCCCYLNPFHESIFFSYLCWLYSCLSAPIHD